MPAFEVTVPAPGTRLLGPLMLAEAAALEAQETLGLRSPGPPLPPAGVGAECPSQPLYLPCLSSSQQVICPTLAAGLRWGGGSGTGLVHCLQVEGV